MIGNIICKTSKTSHVNMRAKGAIRQIGARLRFCQKINKILNCNRKKKTFKTGLSSWRHSKNRSEITFSRCLSNQASVQSNRTNQKSLQFKSIPSKFQSFGGWALVKLASTLDCAGPANWESSPKNARKRAEPRLGVLRENLWPASECTKTRFSAKCNFSQNCKWETTGSGGI